MRRISLHCTVALALVVAASSAFAQAYLPGGSALDAPLPPPLPEPKIAPPVVPKMDAPLRQNYAPPSTRPSFSDRSPVAFRKVPPRAWVLALAKPIREPVPTDNSSS
jgi:hypothetical protein